MKENIHCLLIDDDADDKHFFSVALSEISEKIKFLYSPDAVDALEKLRSGKYKPDFIFLDMNMMPMNGLECLQEIKKISKVVDVPVIIYSTSIDAETKYRTLEAGAFDHFEKPTTIGQLVDYLKRVFQVSE